jgi:hypothetical protein
MKAIFAAAVLALLAPAGLLAQTPAGPVPVTVDNFVRAETDLFLSNLVEEGRIGGFLHRRELSPIEHQAVIRTNRDTLYSSAVFDLDAGPVTITMPDAGARFMSLIVITEDHYVPLVHYGAGPVTLDKAMAGTRYVVAAVRTFVDPADPDDVAAVHALQDAIVVEQASPGSFEIPDWDPASQAQVRDALLTLQSMLPDFRRAFGTKDEVDPVRHLLGTAAAWGGNPDKDAVYLNVTPAENDGTTVYRLGVAEVPVDGFWSVTVYNADGYFEKNPYDAYSINNTTAAKNSDGSIDVQFGGCDGNVPNCLPIMRGWNYTVRLYRPRPEILDGSWTFPTPVPAS